MVIFLKDLCFIPPEGGPYTLNLFYSYPLGRGFPPPSGGHIKWEGINKIRWYKLTEPEMVKDLYNEQLYMEES